MQSRFAFNVLYVHISSMLNQEPTHSNIVKTGTIHQRRISRIVLTIYISTLLNKKFNAVKMILYYQIM